MSILINILLVIHVLISLLIVLLVLMQRPKNEGLGAAFGGGMTDNLFGAQTTNVLQSGTRWLGGIFFGLTMLLSFLYVKSGSTKSGIQKSLSESETPAATPAPESSLPVQPAPAGEKKEGDAATIAPVESDGKPESPANPPEPKPDAPKPEAPEGAKPDAPKDGAPPPPADSPKPAEPPK